MPLKVAILGAGSWGTALATLLPDVETIHLWARNPVLADDITASSENSRYLSGVILRPNTFATSDLSLALCDAEVVVVAVPSSGIRHTISEAANYFNPDALLVSASKGLEDNTGFRMSEVIVDSLAETAGLDRNATIQRTVALSGPNLAMEIANGVPTASVAASVSIEAAERCQQLFMGPTFRVYSSTDVIGVELAGAMKNVIAIGAGVCEGIGFGDNSKAALLTRGLAEITRLGVVLGANPVTFLGLAGVGDLIATCSSKLSRNFRVGIGLGEKKSLDEVLAGIGQVAEGVPTTKAIYNLANKVGVEMPICEALHNAIFNHADIRETISDLMLRPAKKEG